MRFAAPVALWGLAGVPFLAALFWWAISRRRRDLDLLAGRPLVERMVTQVSVQRRIVKALLACAAAVFLVAALARPQWGMGLDPVTRRGVDVVIAMDVSSSMLSEDLRPSRLEKARADAERLLDLLDGDRVAVVAFAGSAATLCPLTLDYGAAQLFIDALSPEILSDQGTDLPTALDEIFSVFDEKERRFRTAVIFSDGEDHQGGVEAAARKAAEAGVIIHTVGVGTAAGGPIPIRRPDGTVAGYKEDSEGRVVTSRLEEGSLSEIAAATGGVYVAATPGGGEIERVAEAVGAMEEREMKQKILARYEERFQIPLALGLLCLVADSLIPERRRPKRPGGAAGLARAAGILIALGLPFVAPGDAAAASARSLVEEGNRHYQEGRFDDALKLYTQAQVESPDAPEIQLNIGNVFYRRGEFDKAREAYRKAWQARDQALAESARYNSGTAGLSSGDLEGAVQDFRDALRLDPSDADARRNLELALLRLQQMEPPPSSQQQKPKPGEGEQKGKPQQSEGSEGEKEKDPKQGEGASKPREQEDPGQSQKPPDAAGKGKESEEARRILDALKGEDKPRVDPGRERRGETRRGKDW